MTQDKPETMPGVEPPPRQAEGPRIVEVSHLLGSEREVILNHQGERYRLRITQSGKLLLTK